MKFDIWSALFGVFGLGVLKLLFEIYKYYKVRKDKETTRNEETSKRQIAIEELFYDLLSGAVRIQEIIEALMYEINAARIWIVKVEHSNPHQFGEVQHISIVNECIQHPMLYPTGTVSPAKQDFQNYAIDVAFQKVLADMILNKTYNKLVRDMDDSLLKKLCESEGIRRVVLLPITNIPSNGVDATKGFLIFMCVQFLTDIDIDSHAESEYTIAQEKIRQIYHKFYNKRLSKLN